MRQYIHMISNTTTISPTDTWKLSGKDVKPQDGWQAATGFYWTFAENKIDMSVEGYYKKTNNYLDYKSGAILSMNENLADDLVQVEGKAYGVELMLKKPLGKLNGWVSYSYSRTLLREMEDRGSATINEGKWYPASHDKPHDIKVVANYKFTHRYSISANLDYSTGRPVTIPVSKYYYAGGYRLYYSNRNAYRIPDYFRLDLAVNIEPGHYLKQLTHLSVTFGVYNVTGRKNAYSIYYTTDEGKSVHGNMLSVFATQIPYINLNLKF
jgi:outer membrane receptor protein involved in Fe transport